MTPISPEYTREDLIIMIHQRDGLVSDLKEVCEKNAARIEALEAALRGIIQTLESLNDTKRASFYRGGVVNELTMALDIARSALSDLARTPRDPSETVNSQERESL